MRFTLPVRGLVLGVLFVSSSGRFLLVISQIGAFGDSGTNPTRDNNEGARSGGKKG